MEGNTTNDQPVSGYNPAVDDIRRHEYPMLEGQCYLDHAGTTLYARSLVQTVSEDLLSNLYGNPHSHSSPSALSSQRVEEVRQKTLQFFNADPDKFDLIFVANATAAIKLVMESFRDYRSSSRDASKGFWYGYHRDCHNSLIGIREVTNGKHRCFGDDTEVERWIDQTERTISRKKGPRKGQIGLFAYPGQSNMTGRRLPLTWVKRIRQSKRGGSVYTLLDAAALATTAALDFSDESAAPDFTCLSFYKIFGFPDLGALIVRKAAGHMLECRRAFFGGTVEMVIAMDRPWHVKKQTLHDRLEDGTLPFHSIIALGAALDVHKRLFGSMQHISAHTAFLTKRLVDGLKALQHPNGKHVCRIYNDASAVYGDPKVQGSAVALNIYHANGQPAGYADVEKRANEQNIYVRSGALCNPGGFANYLSWSPDDMQAAYAAGHRCDKPIQTVYGKPTGVVRVSLGAMSSMEDVDTFLRFVKSTYVDLTVETSTHEAVARTTHAVAQQTGIKVDSMDNFGATEDVESVNGSHDVKEQRYRRAEDTKLTHKVLTALMVWRGKPDSVQSVSA